MIVSAVSALTAIAVAATTATIATNARTTGWAISHVNAAASAERAAQQIRKDIAETVEAVQNGDMTKDITVPTSAKKIKNATNTAKVSAKPNTGEPAVNGARQMSGLAAAATILADATEPLNTKEMVAQMLESGIWSTNGKTPAATIYAAIIREISSKGSNSRFRKADRGKFELNI